MPRSSGDVRLANRLHVLQLRQLNPELGVMELARRAQLNESTVRYILKVYGKTDISLGAPGCKSGAGRPSERSARWKRCVFPFFDLFMYPNPYLGT